MQTASVDMVAPANPAIFVTNVSRTVDGDWSWRGFGYRNHVQKLAFFQANFFFSTNSFSSSAIIAYPPPKVNAPNF